MITPLQHRRRGASLIQYAIVGMGILVICIGGMQLIGINTQCLYQTIGYRVNNSTLSAGCSQNNNQSLVWIGASGASNPYTMGVSTTGQSYTQSLPTYASSKFNKTVSYRLANGTSLPGGLTLSSNGLISGTASNNPSNPSVTTTVQVQAYDDTDTTTSNIFVTIPVKGSYTFTYTGATAYFHVPSTMASTTWKVWGAGGAGSGSNSSLGGAGGYATGIINNNGMSSIEVLVGQGGQPGPGDGAVGMGGALLASTQGSPLYGGRGGGGTFLFVNGTTYLVGGGGGGANGAIGSTNGMNAGAGGGLAGGAGYQYANSISQCPNHAGDAGTGGTQTTGGVSGDGTCSARSASNYDHRSDGSFEQGGMGVTLDNGSEGSGGGGFYGGGAGRDDSGDGQGGGGSSYIGGVVQGSTAPGSGSNPGNADDPVKNSNVGNAGAPKEAGGNGQATVSWGP